MANLTCSLAELTDRQLLAEVTRLAARERSTTAELIVSLAELDSRRLYLGEGCSSLFTYCTQVLHLSEHAAYGRIEGARAVRKFPVIVELLEAGDVHLTAVTLLAAHLTPENHRSLLDSARHKSKRDVEHLIATLRPLPDAPSSVRAEPRGILPRRQPPTSSHISVQKLDGWSLIPRWNEAPTEPRRTTT